MLKDEYLITDAPLKALTIFALPIILGSFFQQIYNMADSIIVGQFVGSSGSRCRCRCTREPLFRCQRVWENEDHRVDILA